MWKHYLKTSRQNVNAKAFFCTAAFICIITFSAYVPKQAEKIVINNLNQLELINRKAELIKEKNGNTIIKINEAEGNGVAWIKNSDFKNGTLEFDIKGKNAIQESFIGIAFHKKNDTTYEAVYFRPFNFRSGNQLNQSHQVQYISLPSYDWKILREKYTNIYESKLKNAPFPDDRFHVKVVVEEETISVFVNGESKPSFTVTPLQATVTGEIGFWVGNHSGGNFRNLIIEKTK